MNSSIQILHFLPGRMRVCLGKGQGQATVIESRCRQIPQVYAATYNNLTGSLLLYYNPLIRGEQIFQLLVKLFREKTEHGTGKGERGKVATSNLQDELLKNSLAIVVYALERLFIPAQSNGSSGLRRLMSPTVLAMLFASKEIISNGLACLITKKQLTADTLTGAAVLAAAVKGKPSSALTIVTLSNLGEMLTQHTAAKTRNHITNMLKLDVPYVWLVGEDGNERKVHIDSIAPGDTTAVFLGEKISVDGSVVSGMGAVDESSLTGEYMPRETLPGSYVYAGSILKTGQLCIKVEKVGDDTAITRMIKLIEQAQNRQAPIQSQADKMAQSLVPVSFAMAIVVYALTRDWSRVMNMLFIDYACGLTLSTATAISAAIGKGAKQGILIKGGQYIERLSEVDTLVFDKTGTITEGTPAIRRIYTFNNYHIDEVLCCAASAEEHSSHPVAGAIMERAREQKLPIPEHGEVETLPGRGIRAEVGESRILVGSDLFMQEEGVDLTPLQAIEGKIIGEDTHNMVYVAANGELMGVISMHDPVRTGMKRTINQLRRLGIDEIILLTGDKKHSASRITSRLFLDNYYAEVLPEDKANLIKWYRQSGNRVMMVGDGINDAPALAYADVGVTLGGKRTDMAMEASDVIVIADDPQQLSTLIRLSQKTMKIIRQNFLTSIMINSIAMMLGAMGTLTPVQAALIHNATTIGVVANSARLLFMEMPGNEK